ncbi:phage/plasmid primase, P4 family [Paraburkholderia sp. ZP32-5]|uniref:phage/plasmid primase, P4 family n=1 Tax=Paraburkholderia sp. ZP32-5 TaxID=2883245 RepID=UPI001F1D3A19|nr:phage/plasmid primase, P4 family [Paraburkholderia sp. ZP32-5]
MNIDPIRKYADLAAKGFSCFPIRQNEKSPLTPHGFKDASLDTEQHRAWAEQFPNSNIAYATGTPSGRLIVLDMDVKNKNSGAKSLVALEKKHGPFPETLTALTQSGGAHYLYTHPEGMKIQCKVGFRDGIDIRADGGYCVAPPSTIDGNKYEWVDPTVPIAPAPEWLLEELAKQGTTRRKRKSRKSEIVSLGGRNHAVMLYAFSMLNNGLDYDRLEDQLLDYNNTCCNPPLPESEVSQIAANVIKSHQENIGNSLHTTDLGNAQRMYELFGSKLRYVSETKQWLEKQESGVWKRVDELYVLFLARRILSLIYEEMYSLNPGSRQDMFEHAQYTESNTGLKNAVDLFRSEPGVALSANSLDQGEWTLPVRNGLIDLRTNEFTPMRPNLHITYTAGVDYDPNAICPNWERFLLRIMNGNVALVEYVRRAVGYTLTCQTSEHVLFFLFGSGANGKSTFLNVLRTLFGDLGAQANGDMLLEKNGAFGMSQNAASSEVARLMGKRLVAMSEVEDGRHFSEKTVKWYTGGEIITARMLYQNAFEFKPRFKLWLAGNYKPTVKGSDHGIWRRMKLIPFTVTIPPEERDPDLERKLCEELPGILNWALLGCQHWRENGYKLNEPEIITNEVAEYRGEMDIVSSWLSEFTRDDPDGEIHFGNTYKFFKAWSEAQYNFAYSGKRFGMILKEKGYKPASKPHRVYKGLTLLVDLEFNENTGAYVGHEFNETEVYQRKKSWQKKLLSNMTDEDFDADGDGDGTPAV